MKDGAGPSRPFEVVLVLEECRFSWPDDGSGIMRDAQTAKPQAFRTGDGWFAYNLATNLAPDPGLSSQLHPTSHPCRTGTSLRHREGGSATRALRTPGPSLTSGPGGDRPAGPGGGVTMQTNGANGHHQHEVSEKRPPPGAFPCRLDMEICICGARRWVGPERRPRHPVAVRQPGNQEACGK